MVIPQGITFGEYHTAPPYAKQGDKIGIFHSSGEGGDFDRKAFEAHMAKAIETFYKENF